MEALLAIAQDLDSLRALQRSGPLFPNLVDDDASLEFWSRPYTHVRSICHGPIVLTVSKTVAATEGHIGLCIVGDPSLLRRTVPAGLHIERASSNGYAHRIILRLDVYSRMMASAGKCCSDQRSARLTPESLCERYCALPVHNCCVQ